VGSGPELGAVTVCRNVGFSLVRGSSDTLDLTGLGLLVGWFNFAPQPLAGLDFTLVCHTLALGLRSVFDQLSQEHRYPIEQ